MTEEVDSLSVATCNVLHDIAKHAHMLAIGLQNVAPPQETGQSKSILYLTEIAAQLEGLCRQMKGLSTSNAKEE
jgi:hypothetical protein